MTLASTEPRAVTGGALGGEILRAFLVFSVLFVALTWTAEHLASRELDARAMVRRLDLGQDEAERIADAVAALAWSRNGIDFDRLRDRRDDLAQVVDERLWARSFVQYVEIRDRDGVPFLFLTREGEGKDASFGLSGSGSAAAADTVQVARAPLLGTAGPDGDVRLGISGEAFQREIAGLQHALRVKVYLAAFFGLAVLGVGFLYVLHLIRRIRRLEEAKIQADRRATMGFLARGLAHEIRNPLNAMNMNLQMLEEELSGVAGTGSDWVDMLHDTKKEVKRLGDLVTSFLDYARGTPVQLVRRDLNDELREVARLFGADFAKHGVELVLDLAQELPPWEIDDRQFRQALINLLVNARQVLRSGGRVVLRSKLASGGDVLLEVEDDGPGIAPEALPRIFEPFFTTKGGGTGLGLPIAQQIVERHHGRLEVESAPGLGAIFRIRLSRKGARGVFPAASEAAS
jgi:signal transduction histidine kinase